MTYAIRKGQIIEASIVRENKLGTGVWCQYDLRKKNILVSYTNIFSTKEDARSEVKRRETIRQIKNERAKVEHEKLMIQLQKEQEILDRLKGC